MGVVIVEEEGTVFEVNLGRPIVTNGVFATRLFPNYFGQDLLFLISYTVNYVEFSCVSLALAMSVTTCTLDFSHAVLILCRLFIADPRLLTDIHGRIGRFAGGIITC